jgi:hypothetical protein
MQDLCTVVIFGVIINSGRDARHPTPHIHIYPAASRGPAGANRRFDRNEQDRRNGLDE